MVKRRFAFLTIATILGLITFLGSTPAVSAQAGIYELVGSRGLPSPSRAC